MPKTRALLADAGVTFENSFSPYPLCCPARSSFLTGLYTHNHEVWSHAEPWGFKVLKDADTLPVWLQQAGYDTVFLGKYLNGYGAQPAPDGSSPTSTTYIPPGWSDWRGAIDGGPGPDFPDKDGGTYRFFNTTLNDNGEFYLEPGRYQSDVFGDLSSQIIADNAGDDRPFFFWANYVAPHHGQPGEPDDPKPIKRDDGATTRFQTTARPAEVRGRFDAVPPRRRARPERTTSATSPSSSTSCRHSTPPSSPASSRPPASAPRRSRSSTTRWRRRSRRSRRAASSTRRSLRSPRTTVTSSGSTASGRARSFPTSPPSPCRCWSAVRASPGEVRTDPFTSIDFAPTILQAAATTVDWPLNGRSMLDVARSGDRGWDRAVLTETGPRNVVADLDESGPTLKTKDPVLWPSGSPKACGTRNFLYVEHASGEVELYDMRTDPGQHQPHRPGVLRARRGGTRADPG